MAGRIALDLKQFKHLKSNDKSTTLQHKDGHTLQISHNKLSPEFKAQLSALSGISKEAMTRDQADESREKKMAEGGGVLNSIWNGRPLEPSKNPGNPTPQQDPQKAKDMAAPFKTVSSSQPQQKAEGGEIRQKLADGGLPDIGGVKQIVPERQPGPDVDYNPQPKFQGEAGFTPEDFGKLIGYAAHGLTEAKKKAGEVASNVGKDVNQGVMQAGGPDLSGADEQQPQATAAPTPQQSTAPQPQDQVAAPAPQPQDQSAPQPQAAAAPSLAPGEQPQANMKATIPGAIQNAEQGANQAIDSANQSGVAAGDIAEARAKVANEGADTLLAQQQKFQADFDELNKERLAHIQDMQNGFIDPEKYWQNHSKVASGIGMILAGFNPTTNPNAAMNFLKFQMEQNLDAQKQNLNAKNNILSSTMQQFGNIKDATNMARIYQQDALAQQMLAAAPQAQNDQARLLIQQKAGELQQDSAKKLYDMAKDRQFYNLINQAPGQGAKGDPEAAFQQRNRALNYYSPQTASYEAERHVPGVGDAPIPVPENVRSKLIAHQNFDTMAKRYQEYSQKHAANWANLDIPERLKIQAEGASMGKELQSVLNSTLEGGVSDAQRGELEKMLPSDPTKFLPSVNALPKIKGLIDSNQSRFNTLKKAYHLPESKQEEQKQEQQVVTGKDGKQYQVKIINGKSYHVPVGQ